MEPPNVLSFDFDPKSVDTSTSFQEITVTARLTDDLSGFSQGYFRFQSPSKIQDIGAWFSSYERTSGNELDGTYERKITLPQYSEPGTWRLSSIELRDNVGNWKYISGVELEALGIPIEFEVESVGDTKPPAIASFDFNPKAVDTSTSSREIIVTARLTDDLSGFSQGYFRFESPSKIQDIGVWFSSSERTSGNELDGTYERKITLPQYSEPGTWRLSSVELRDNAGNWKYISGVELEALGIPTEFEVESVGDTTTPAIASFDFHPKAVDTSTSPQEITVTARLTDDLSGFSQGYFRFQSPSKIQDIGAWFSSYERTSGNELDGTYERKITLPRYSEPGTWILSSVELRDNVGNWKYISGVEVEALGIPTTFRNVHSGVFSISGLKFNDLNNNGAKDADESGLPGWRIELLFEGEVIDSTVTSADGTYSFDHLAPKSYTVREVQKAGWVQTYPPGGSHSVTLVDADSTGNDFGNHQIMKQDTQPPEIVSFDFDPKAVDTSTSSRQITVTADFADDLSGFDQGDIRFYSPSESQSIGAWFSYHNRISGNEIEGTYQYKIDLPQYSEPGTWKLSHMRVSDRVGNSKYLSGDEIAALGFPIEFEVESIGDTTAPNVASFDFDPKAVDTSTSSRQITVTADFADDLSGFDQGDIRFYSPSESQSIGAWFSYHNRISGNEIEGTYQYKIDLPQYSEPGTWKLSHMRVSDRVGNSKYLSGDEIAALGFPTEFEVESIGDTMPPNIANFDFDPKAVDTSTSSQEITVTADLADDLSGFDQGDIRFYSPSESQSIGAWFSSHNRISGNEIEGTYLYKIDLPQYSEPGTWKLSHMRVSDRVGNSKYLSGDEMAALGFPTNFRNAHSGVFSISGMKFNDLNNNGAKDADESGLPGWRIELLFEGEVIDSTVTSADGTYSFDHLAPKSYTVREVQKAGWVQTYPPGGSHSVTLDDADSTGNDFGNHQIMKQDTQPPEIVSFDFDPKVLDVSTSSKEITFTTRLTDDLSGVENAMMLICIPEGCHQQWGSSIGSYNLVSGDMLDGVYKSEMTIPRYSHQGIWKLNSIDIYDKVGNRRVITGVEMESLGFPTEFEVVSEGDTEPPTIVDMDFDPKSIDTSASSQVITFTTHLTDDLSGIYYMNMWFLSPSGEQSAGFSFWSASDLVSGNKLDGVYVSKVRLPRYSEKGIWKLNHVHVGDEVHNIRWLSQSEIADLGFPTEFEVVSDGDTEPPNVVSFDFDPKHVDTSTSHQEIIFRIRLTDDLSGVSSFSGQFKGLSGDQYAAFVESLTPSSLISGDEIDGIYECTMTLPQYSLRGTWQLESLSLVDNVGNQRLLNKDDMAALGFPIEFQNNPSSSCLTIEKIASSSSASPGDLLNYTIIYKNSGDARLTEVVITESYPKGVEFVSASPAPDHGTNNRWTIGDLSPGKSGKITVTVRVPELQDLEFSGEGMITGTGFVNARGSLSTSRGPLDLKNVVTITSAQTGPSSASASVTIADPGTELETREHGSGLYESGEVVWVRTENKSISMEKEMVASYSPTTLGLYNDRVVEYSSRWTQEAKAKNRVTGTSMSQSNRYATFIDRESRIFLDENQSVMEVDSDFDGRGHIGFLKMPSGASSPRATPIFEAREDYVGSFKVLERIDEYGSSVTSDKAASGRGLVVVDKRIGSVQRTYESGTGTYDSEELIRTSTNYIAKDISLVHSPMSQRLTDSTSIDASMKWKEGMYSRNPGTSFIGEEYTSITELDKETVARGLNEMDTDAEFSGQARFRAILDRSQGGRDPEVDFDEQYAGDYSIQRRVHFSGVAKYDRPHLNVTKTLDDVYEEVLPWDHGEAHLEGAVKKRTVAVYTIRIENDGNRVLQPVYVQDRFPPGATFIEPSSIRPDYLTETGAGWNLTHLSIGGAVEISLSLDVSKYYSAGHPPELVNRVEVCGVYDDEQVCASNFSALEIRWLTCCLDDPVSVAKAAEIDPSNPRVVRYRIDVSNHDDATRVATVTDRLPAGMDLLESSIPFASYEGGVVVWNILEIGPGGTATIEFSTLAPGEGRFTNSVEVDARSVDGAVVQPVWATCVIDVGAVEDECGPTGCGIWQPPNWQFEHDGYQPDVMNCELLTCTGCGGTESCLAP